MYVRMLVTIDGVEETDVDAMKESIVDHLLQQFPAAVVAIGDLPDGDPEDGGEA